MTIGQGYLEQDLQVAARDATIVFLAAMGGKIINNFDAGAIIYKRLTVLFPRIWGNGSFVDRRCDLVH